MSNILHSLQLELFYVRFSSIYTWDTPSLYNPLATQASLFPYSKTYDHLWSILKSIAYPFYLFLIPHVYEVASISLIILLKSTNKHYRKHLIAFLSQIWLLRVLGLLRFSWWTAQILSWWLACDSFDTHYHNGHA